MLTLATKVCYSLSLSPLGNWDYFLFVTGKIGNQSKCVYCALALNLAWYEFVFESHMIPEYKYIILLSLTCREYIGNAIIINNNVLT